MSLTANVPYVRSLAVHATLQLMISANNLLFLDVQIMAGGPEAMETLQEDHETRELLQRLEKAMSTVK